MCLIKEEELRRSMRLAQYQSLSAIQQHHAMAPNQVGQVAGRSVRKVDSENTVASRMNNMHAISTHEDRLLESKVNTIKKIDSYLARKVQTPHGELV